MWQRAWFRWSVRVLALAVLAVLATVFYLRSRGQRELDDARKEFTEKVGSLDLTAYASKPVPEEENGAVWLLAGARAVVIFQPERAGLKSLAETPSSRWTQEQAGFAKRLLERNAPALTLLHRSLGKKACNLTDANSDGAGIGLQEVKAARLLAADCRDALRQGDMNRFFASAEILGTLTSAQEREVDLIDLLLSSYAERLLLPVLQEAASSSTLDKADVTKLDDLIPHVDLMESWRKTQGKKVAEFEDRMANGSEDEYLGWRPNWSARLKEWVLGDLDNAAYLRMWVRSMPWTIKPYGSRSLLPPPPLPSRFWGPWSVIGSIQTPNLWGASGRLQATMALRQMTLLGLQVRKAGLEKGVYPADLSAFPGAKIADPFSGKPVAYTLNSDGSATLMVPGADVLWKRVTQGKGAAVSFTWTLPPLSREVDRRK